MSKSSDIIILGSGISSAQTLLELINNFNSESWYRSVTIIEKTGEFNKGVPYGKRSGNGNLIITDLKSFLPPAELEEFENWLSLVNFNDVCRELYSNDERFKLWVDRNRKSLDEHDYRSLHVPRCLYGSFLEEKINTAVERNKKEFRTGKNRLSIEYVHGEAEDIRNAAVSNKADNFVVKYRNSQGGENHISAQKIVLAIGSTPTCDPRAAGRNHPGASGRVIDFYQKSFDDVLSSLQKDVQNQGAPYRILIIGSNASASEVIYSLYWSESIRDSLQLISLSPSGMLPVRENLSDREAYVPEFLLKLENTGVSSAKVLHDTAILDLKNARSLKYDLSLFMPSISEVVNRLLATLITAEVREFVAYYGHSLGRYQRRIGSEYYSAATEFQAEDKLEVLLGKFVEVSDSGVVSYLPSSSNEVVTYPQPIDTVINCGGTESVSHDSSSRLIRNLVVGEMLRPSRSGRGIDLDNQMQCAPNMYVVGPLLADNIIKKENIWHAEHCGRIIRYARQLATELVKHPR